MSRELVEVNGIVFKRKKYKEADVLAKVLSKELGIFTIDVRGALRAKSQLGSATLNFSYGNFVINTSKKGISNLRTFKNVKQFDNIYLDIIKQAYASYILDLVDHAYIEYQDVGKTYDLVFDALKKINNNDDPEIIKQMVELKMLKVFGVAPNFTECLVCHKTQGKFDYSMELGGIICSDHFNSSYNRMHLDPKTVSLIRTLALVDINKLGKIEINNDLKMQSRKVIERMYTNYLDLTLKSKKFLDELTVFSV